MRALGCYESQFVANAANRRLLEVVEQQAAYWGALIGVRHGEPFFGREEIGIGSISHLI